MHAVGCAVGAWLYEKGAASGAYNNVEFAYKWILTYETFVHAYMHISAFM